MPRNVITPVPTFAQQPAENSNLTANYDVAVFDGHAALFHYKYSTAWIHETLVTNAKLSRVQHVVYVVHSTRLVYFPKDREISTQSDKKKSKN